MTPELEEFVKILDKQTEKYEKQVEKAQHELQAIARIKQNPELYVKDFKKDFPHLFSKG
jgi:prefoldin subunit 5